MNQYMACVNSGHPVLAAVFLCFANWGQRTGLFLVYLTWCCKTESIISPPLTKPLSSSSCFLLTSCHHQSFTFYLFSHLISQNHDWLYFLSIFLPFFYDPATLNLNIYGSFHSCALSLFFFFLLPSTLHLSWLTGKDSDAGRGWGQEEKGPTED